jgi:hypothetical protein
MLKMYLNYRTRQRLIEKELVNEDVKNLFTNHQPTFSHSSLMWGLICLLVGISMVIMRAIDYVSGETAFGVMLIAAGVGLLAYYIIGTAKAKERDNNKP